MKKFWKILSLSIGGLILLIIIVLGVFSWIILTPEKLTPIVKKHIPQFISCQVNLDKVELTLIKAFPNIGLNISNLCMVNPLSDEISDTLAAIQNFTFSLNIKEFFKSNNIVVNQIIIDKGQFNIFVDSTGKTNFDIFIEQNKKKQEDTSSLQLHLIDLKNLKINDIYIHYIDKKNKAEAQITGFSLFAKGKIRKSAWNVKAEAESKAVCFKMSNGFQIAGDIHALEAQLTANMQVPDSISVLLSLNLPEISFRKDSVDYLKSATMKLILPFTYELSTQKYDLQDFSFSLLEKELIEVAMTELPSTLFVGGEIFVTGFAKGSLTDTMLPAINVNVLLKEGMVRMSELLPNDINPIEVNMDMSIQKGDICKLNINELKLKTGQSSLSMAGKIDNLFNKQKFNIQGNTHVITQEFHSLLGTHGIDLAGIMDAQFNTQFSINQLNKAHLPNIKANVNINFQQLNLNYQDGLKMMSPQFHAEIHLSGNSHQVNNDFLTAQINALELFVSQFNTIEIYTSRPQINLRIPAYNEKMTVPRILAHLNMETADIQTDSMKLALQQPNADIDFSLVGIKAQISMQNIGYQDYSIYANINQPNMDVKINPSVKNPGVYLGNIAYRSNSLLASIEQKHQIAVQLLSVEGKMQYDKKEKDMLLSLNPKINLKLSNAHVETTEFPKAIEIPDIDFYFSPKHTEIRNSRFTLGNSAFQLKGSLDDLDKYLKNSGLLVGRLDFSSESTYVTELMDIFNQFGSDSVALANDTEKVNQNDNPFIVPKGIDFVMNTHIHKAYVHETELRNLKGNLSLKDGLLVLEEVGFTSEAAEMQLTAMYRSLRKNHLFAGINFHLLNIDMAKLIAMFPEIDTLVPMLKSFGGEAEFHFGIETYLKSNYEPKYSTLRGAAAIKGRNLVVLDNETYRKISKKLLFNKKSKNQIDSLSMEFTIFKNEIDIYPFLLSMAQYQAILSGRHNLDMSLNYDISLVKSPLPFRLGLNISGTFDEPRYKLEPPKYAKIYHPNPPKELDKMILELKKRIYDSLNETTKE
jgi:hypothetical protein